MGNIHNIACIYIRTLCDKLLLSDVSSIKRPHETELKEILQLNQQQCSLSLLFHQSE